MKRNNLQLLLKEAEKEIKAIVLESDGEIIDERLIGGMISSLTLFFSSFAQNFYHQGVKDGRRNFIRRERKFFTLDRRGAGIVYFVDKNKLPEEGRMETKVTTFYQRGKKPITYEEGKHGQ